MSETAKRLCPICGRAADAHYKPFCSARCANVDLSRWLNEGYLIPARPDADEQDSASEGNAEIGAGSGATIEADAPPVGAAPTRRRKPN